MILKLFIGDFSINKTETTNVTIFTTFGQYADMFGALVAVESDVAVADELGIS